MSLSPQPGALLLSPMNKQPLPKSLLELLLARLTATATKHQLAPELPLERDAPVLRRLLVNDGVVVLQVGAEALGLERDPQSVLVHGVGVLGPVAEVVRVEGEGLAEVFDGLGGFVEEDLRWGVRRVCGRGGGGRGGGWGLCAWWGLEGLKLIPHHACNTTHRTMLSASTRSKQHT